MLVEPKYLVDAAEVSGMLDESNTRIIDCRFELTDPAAGRAAYLSGHIPGAVYADLDRDLAGPVGPGTGRHPLPGPHELAATFSALGIDETTRVIVYDDGPGAIAARAWWLLRWLGHDSASLLDGGFRAWEAQDLPVEQGAVSVARAAFVPRPRDELVLGTAEILEAGDSADSLSLVDARSADRFMGLQEPIDRVAGHIPGSKNLPYTDNVGADGRWKPVDEIRRRLAAELGAPAGQRWSVMCGSGVTACHLVIAGLLAGYPEPRLYVGSWSEWVADESRKVATLHGEDGTRGREYAEDP